MHNITCVVYDLDGTLVNSIQLNTDSRIHTFSQKNLDITGYDLDFLRYQATPISFEKLIQLTGVSLTAEEKKVWLAEKQKYIAENLNRVQEAPQAQKTIKKLHEAGYTVCICSSAPRWFIGQMLQTFSGFGTYISKILGEEDVERKKPFPDILLKIQEDLGLSQEKFIYIGDAITDYQAAHEAGWKFLGYTGIIQKNPFPASVEIIDSHEGIFNYL